jgi:hypothetical protein
MERALWNKADVEGSSPDMEEGGMRWPWIFWAAAALMGCGDIARCQSTADAVKAADGSDSVSSSFDSAKLTKQPVFRLALNSQLMTPAPGTDEPPAENWLAEGMRTSLPESSAGECCCPSKADTGKAWTPNCDNCPNYGFYGLFGYDSWRGVPDDSWQNNGLHVGLNFGTRLGRFSDLTGIGFQAGATMGVDNWQGMDYRPSDNNASQQQAFVTYGFFRRATDTCRFSGALVQDWMLNDNFGVFSQNPTISQWRAQLGYAVNAWNEIGFWGTWRCTGSTRDVTGVGSTSWRAVDQASFYWHHKWRAWGPDTSFWMGIPERKRLNGDGSLGDYVVGVSANLPLSNWVSIYNVLTYMHSSSRPSPTASEENAWNFTMGLAFYPNRAARSSTVAGRCWMPLMPVANNGYFLVDTNNH